jgi:enoyl-CoA hydratase
MIELREARHIVILELAHGKANALDLELCRRMVDVLQEIAAGPAKALVLTGRGRIFCAGVDLLRLLEGGPDYAAVFVPALVAAVRALFEFPRPVVAALNGHAVAGGCVLACAADRRLIANTGARVGVPELRVGVPFPAAAIEVMRAALTPARFRTLILGGATLEPDAACEWGLVDEVVPADSLLDTALAAAEDLASIPAAAFAVSKKQMRMSALLRMDAADAQYGEEVMRLWTSAETLGAVERYVHATLGKGRPDRTR